VPIAHFIHADIWMWKSPPPLSTPWPHFIQLRMFLATDMQLYASAGYAVVLASDGEEALDQYETENPDIAILDFNMPQRSGIEVIQAIRVMEAPGVRMPAVILSASVTIEARERATGAGADEFLGKPFEAAALIQLIDRLGAQTPRGRMARNSANQLDQH
jgi:CheY-like chemotaxis protein